MGRALVAEDAETLRRLLATLLQRQGLQVSTAKTGREALGHLQSTDYDLILLDLMMPVMSGDEFRRRQLAEPEYAGVPVICMTAAHDGSQRARHMKAAQFFQKPVDFDQLITAVRRLTHA